MKDDGLEIIGLIFILFSQNGNLFEGVFDRNVRMIGASLQPVSWPGVGPCS